MEKPNGLAKSERLSSLTAVKRLFKDGTTGFVYPYRYIIMSQKSASPSVEVLFSVPKRFHKRANKRNLLRRRTKEAYRLNKQSLTTLATERELDLDVALIYSAKELLSYKSIEHVLNRILAEIQKRC